MKRFFVCILILTLASICGGADYYVKNGGSDAADGLSDGNAWATVNKVNDTTLNAGDNVYFNRGDTWREINTLSDGEDGTDGSPITFGAYGTGDKPLFIGSVDYSAATDWIDEGSNIWHGRQLSETGVTGSNLIASNPTFISDITTGWNMSENGTNGVESHTTTVGEYEPDSGGFKYLTGDNNGGSTSDVQLLSDQAMSIVEGTWYKMTFQAKVTVENETLPPITFFKQTTPFTAYYSERVGHTPTITTSWAEHAVYFKASVSAADLRIAILFGSTTLAENQILYLDTFSLKALDPVSPLLSDVGNIIFDGATSFGWRAHTTVPSDGDVGAIPGDTTWEEGDLASQDDYWYDATNDLVKVFSIGNPGTLHAIDIEVMQEGKALEIDDRDWIVFQDLAFKYWSFVVSASDTNNTIYQRLDMSYMGGTLSSNGQARQGGGIELWENNTECTVRNCNIDNIYEGGISFQGTANDTAVDGMYFYNNLITNCEYSFALWLDNDANDNPTAATIDNMQVYNNTCLYAGSGWAHKQREVFDRGTHLNLSGTFAVVTDGFIKNNIFYQATEGLVMFWFDIQATNNTGFLQDFNCYYQPNATDLLMWMAKNQGEFGQDYQFNELADWQADTITQGKPQDQKSIAIDPAMIQVPGLELVANGDFRTGDKTNWSGSAQWAYDLGTIKVTADTNFRFLQQDFGSVIGQTYTLSYNVYQNSLVGAATQLTLASQGSFGSVTLATTVGFHTQNITATKEADSDDWELRITLPNTQTSGTIAIGNISIKKVVTDNLKVTTSSPCVGAGEYVGITQDFDLVYISPPVTIGAYYIHGGSVMRGRFNGTTRDQRSRY